MVIQVKLDEHHVRRLNREGGVLKLSHSDHRNYEVTYSETESVYDMDLSVFIDDRDRHPAITLRGRIVKDLVMEMLDNMGKQHLKNVITWAQSKVDHLEDKPWELGKVKEGFHKS